MLCIYMFLCCYLSVFTGNIADKMGKNIKDINAVHIYVSVLLSFSVHGMILQIKWGKI